MNVLVIPEDFRKDQYVLKPVVQAMLAALGKPRANVQVCKDPLLQGVVRALDWNEIEAILDRYKGMVSIFLLIVDRDGLPGRRTALDALERRAAGYLGVGKAFFGENAWQEIEVWALAAAEDLPWTWADVRAESHSKETYFEPYATAKGLGNEPGEGRQTLGSDAGRKYHRVRQLCPEDVNALHGRLAAFVNPSS